MRQLDAEDSFIARDVVYQLGEPTTDEHECRAYKLSSDYQRRVGLAAAEQLEKAGCRLAQVLNQALRGAASRSTEAP